MGNGGKKMLVHLAVNMLALIAVDYLVKGVYFGGLGSILVAALLMMVLNKLVKPILELISLPVTCLTFGLFEIVISAFILKLVDVLMPSVWFMSASRYFIAVIIIGVINAIFGGE